MMDGDSRLGRIYTQAHTRIFADTAANQRTHGVSPAALRNASLRPFRRCYGSRPRLQPPQAPRMRPSHPAQQRRCNCEWELACL